MELSKAWDTLNHDFFLGKLKAFGLHADVLTFV